MERSGRIAITALGFVLAGAGAGSAQEPPPPTDYPARSIYVEAGGLPAFEGAPYSLNVEQRLIPRTYLRLGVFVGPVDAQMTMKLPLLLAYVAPGSLHNFDVGAGVRWDVFGASSDEVRLAATVGYRFQELPHGALLRAGLNFDMHSISDGSSAWKFRPWPSLSIGFGF